MLLYPALYQLACETHIKTVRTMPATMRQLVYPTYTSPDKFKFRTIAKPEISGPTEVIVKVYAASVNPVDVKRASGMMKFVIFDK